MQAGRRELVGAAGARQSAGAVWQRTQVVVRGECGEAVVKCAAVSVFRTQPPCCAVEGQAAQRCVNLLLPRRTVGG